MRTKLSLEDLGGFLDEPHVAALATLRTDGTVLLSPVWHEWRDGGFNMWIAVDDVKVRHLRRDPGRPSWSPSPTRRSEASRFEALHS